MLTVLPCHLGDGPGFFLLGTDITAQKELQRELARSERALRRQATITDERNAALRVLLEQREQDRAELEERVVGNVEQLIEPTLDRLSKTLRHRPERMELEALRVNLREIVGPFAQRLRDVKGGAAPLTRRETEVANLVRLGKTSDEIAEALHIEPLLRRLPPRQHPPQARHPQARAAPRDAPRVARRRPAACRRDGRPARPAATGSRAARPRTRRARRAPARP